MPLQPTLPAEGTYTEVEKDFIDLQPPGLWPENQDSNFGQVRKVITDIVQECVDEINHLSAEAYIATADEYLGLWEEIVHVPISPAGKTTTERRTIAGPRLHYGAFTRTRRREIVESFIIATFGESVALTSSGVELTSGGVPLYSGTFSLTGTYNIVEDVENFSYDVRILDTVTVDADALEKELERITPAGISFTITFTPTP